MFCPDCGTRSADQDRFCVTCGRALGGTLAGATGLAVSQVTTPPAAGAATGLGVAGTGVEGGTGPLIDATFLPPDAAEAAATRAADTGVHTGATRTLGFGGNTGPLQIGAFGQRYHIIKMLGAGGMGAVYHAWDDELGVAVALKVIRAEHLADPLAAEALERRFKRELVLARQITHKHVVRIHDLGDVAGIKYLTMPFIQGADLATILRREGRLPVARTLALARQMLSGLSAAHQAGVVHRDLKPANIMIDPEDQAYIMDFGIARSSTTPSATAAGAVVGTLAYMAPEQARGEVVDQRADVYSFGLILRDMLVGLRPGAMGDGAVGELMTRMNAAPSLKTADAAASDDLERIVKRCLEPSVEARYPDASSVLRDIEALDDYGRVRSAALPPAAVPAAPAPRRFLWMAAAAVALLAIAAPAVWWLSASRPTPPAAAEATPALTLAVLPFRNASGDPTLDALGSSVAEILRAELGESAQLRTASAGRVQQTLRDLRVADDEVLNDPMLRRVSELTNAQAIVWGQILKLGNQIQLVASMQDTRRTGDTQTLNASAASAEALLPTITQLADQIRQRIARSPEAADELKGTSLKPTTSSFTALHEFNVGVQLARTGNHADALKHFEIATQEDEEFGLAYARLAISHAALGHDEEAARFARQAVALAGRVSAYERYLIDATQARVLNDIPKAIGALESVVNVSPNDSDLLFELGSLYESSGNAQKAHDVFVSLLGKDPKSVDALLANGRVLIRLQRPNESLEFLTRALSLSIELDNEDARGSVLQALGIAYKQLDKPTEALTHYQQALEIRRRRGQETAIAASLNEIGQIQARMGQHDLALRSYDEALRIRRTIGDKRGIGTVLINVGSLQEERGHSDAALVTLREALQIQRDTGNEALEALCLNLIGSIYYSKGQYDDAVTNLDRALALREKQQVPRDIADTVHNLAETAVRTGQLDQALKYYLRAIDLRRSSDDARGAAMESFGTGRVFEWQGRFTAAVDAKRTAYDAFKRLNDRSYWYGAILTGYGTTLARAGRGADAQPLLAEAVQFARDLKNPALLAEALAGDGERLQFAGDAEGARARFEAALAEATRTADREVILGVRLNVEKAAAAREPGAARATRLAEFAAEADAAGLKHLAMDAVVSRAEVLIHEKQHAAAQRELERALARIEALNLRVLQARAHALLGRIASAGGRPAEARRQFTQALRAFEELRKDAGSDGVLQRSDLAAAFAEAQRGS